MICSAHFRFQTYSTPGKSTWFDWIFSFFLESIYTDYAPVLMILFYILCSRLGISALYFSPFRFGRADVDDSRIGPRGWNCVSSCPRQKIKNVYYLPGTRSRLDARDWDEWSMVVRNRPTINRRRFTVVFDSNAKYEVYFLSAPKGVSILQWCSSGFWAQWRTH